MNYTERMRTARTLLSAEEFDIYPFEEDKRYELDEGELIEMTRPAYKHTRVLGRLCYRLSSYFETNHLGEALISENLYALSSSTRRSPDVAVILGNRHEELKDAKVIPIIPEIAVEVLSPSETHTQIHRKMTQYFKDGVKEVWQVQPEDSTEEIWSGPRLAAKALTGEDSITSALLPGVSVDLAELVY